MFRDHTLKGFPQTNLPPLAQALIIHAVRDEGKQTGAELTVLRKQVLAGTHDSHPAAKAYKTERKRLMGVSVQDMPPATRDMWLLLESISQRKGIIGHRKVWELLGVPPKRGRDYLSRSADFVEWPLWFTLRHAAFDR